MNKTDEYGLRCLITTENDVEMLHIEVRYKHFPAQCYYKHLTFKELSSSLQSLFNNLSHLYVYMNRPEMVYFDDSTARLKICVPIAGEIRQFQIELESKGRAQGLKHRIMLMEQEKARVQDQFNKLKQEKQGQLEQLKQQLLKEKNQREQLQKQIEQIENSLVVTQNQITALRFECQYKMKNKPQDNAQGYIDLEVQKPEVVVIKESLQSEQNEQLSKIQREKSTTTPFQNAFAKKSPNFKQKISINLQKIINSSKNPQPQTRKQFWIRQVSLLKKPKTLILKKLINPSVNFEQQTTLTINQIQLKKMLFVEIFINLQQINLSRNHIRNMEGMLNLKNLARLDLSENMIDTIKGLTNSHRLNELILHTNKIKSILNIFHLSNIKVLSLSKNEIEVIPDQISKLYRLVQLRIAHNKVKTVSERIQLLKNLKVFSIVANKCYSENNTSKEVIDRLINNGVKTTSGIYI